MTRPSQADESGWQRDPLAPSSRIRTFKWRTWLVGLALVPLIAFVCAWIFMRPPPPDGPWSRWDLFSPAGYVGWLITVAATVGIIAGAVALIRSGRSEGGSLLLVCLIPALLIVALPGWMYSTRCPDQIPRASMLDPLPPGSVMVSTSRDDFRGEAELDVEVDTDGTPFAEARDLAYQHYERLGWVRNPTYPVQLRAGEWGLFIGPSGSADGASPKHLFHERDEVGSPDRMALSLYNTDADCDIFD